MKIRKKIVFALFAAVLISADFILWSQAPVNHTQWRELSQWSYDSLKQSTVSIVRSDNPALSNPRPVTESLEYEQIEEMVRLAVELAGGLESCLEPDDRKIVIKPNIVEPVVPVDKGLGVNTDWQVVKALVLLLYRINPEFEIIVAEGAGGWARPGTPNAPSWAESDGYTISGYRTMIETLQNDPGYANLNLEWVDLNYDDTVRVAVPEPRISDDQTLFFLPRTLVEADFIINAPVLKVHSPCITVGLKNWIGVLPGMVYGWSKGTGYDRNGILLNHTPGRLQKDMVEIVRTLGCDFVLVDAIVGREKEKGFWGISKRTNMIIAGEDVVSVDVVSAHLMDINPDDVEHVCLAALSGLGQNDLEKIEVVGNTSEESKARFIKNEKYTPSSLINPDYPYYGQSNRVWLLKGGFPGLDLETDYLGNEATAAPQLGKDGWSEPIYFYDDLIDPAAFFGDTADCIHYAFSYLTVPESHPAQLWVGSGQELAVWLNGEQVYKYDGTFRSHKLPNDVVEVNVKAGVNRILVKAGQRDGISQFSLNICETETDKNYAGNRLAGAKFLYWVEPERMKGDYNGDDRVDIMDLISLLRVMHERDQDPEYDFNADGRVDIFDLIGLLNYLSENRFK